MDRPLTHAQTRENLRMLGHNPRKPLGQNFLVDPNIVRKSLRLAEIESGDVVIEIGPGLGTLTRALLTAGAEVYAVEVDPTLASALQGNQWPRLHLLEGDAVDHPIAGYAGSDPLPSCKVVANLPYAITSPWIERLLAGPLPLRLVLMMQREAAQRLTAMPGSKHLGAAAIFLHAAYHFDSRHPVARQCFYPVPGVDSVLAVWQRKPRPLVYPTERRDSIRRLFTQRRKQLQALLRDQPIMANWFEDLVREGICQPTARAEEVPFAAWEKLAHPIDDAFIGEN